MKKINEIKQVLLNVNDEILSIEEVAEMFRVKPAAIRKRVQRGTIPSYKVKGSRRRWFSKADIIASIKSEQT
ncbi:MAG: helix-turn-helix domain-containing protein [Prevotella sp.]|nr:helix-turn-helix domain-containing protein [Prevotella sp.]